MYEEALSSAQTELKSVLKGEIYFDKTHRILFSTDASAYKEIPLAVAFPKDAEDVKTLIRFAIENRTSLIPRGAGTSLAGQVTGNGIAVDCSKYMNKIIALNTEKKIVRVEPGVVLSDLNRYIKKFGLFFGPETSTANRCTLGGMTGNNACGLHSLAYGSVRDHIVEVKAILSDSSEVVFKELTPAEFEKKCNETVLESSIYKTLKHLLSEQDLQNEISENYPDSSLKRRNTGYALDFLAQTSAFGNFDKNLNLSEIIAGSEGTLAYITEISLKLVELPPPHKALIIPHFDKLEKVFDANLLLLKHHPSAIELSDQKIIQAASSNILQKQNKTLIQGLPAAILIAEINAISEQELYSKITRIENELRTSGLTYHIATALGKEIEKVWEFRKAGLGLLSNIPGDTIPVSLVEDTAVSPEKLKEYIGEFQQLLAKYKLDSVYHAHIGSGELHLRPMLNLKNDEDLRLFREIATKTAQLVKKYRGSLSGEHGDGRLRGEFIPLMYGEKIYNAFKHIKAAFDPSGIFNPGKIIDTPPMDMFLRYSSNTNPDFPTTFSFQKEQGYFRAVEKCNGSGDCIKSSEAGGVMCPSYQATHDERLSTRGRANFLRNILETDPHPFRNKDLYELLDLCLSCKACKSECPSNVDITKLKAEFLNGYYKNNRIPLHVYLTAHFGTIYSILAKLHGFSNAFIKNKITAKIIKKFLGFAAQRSLPGIKPFKYKPQKITKSKKIYLYIDEFTRTIDSEIGMNAVLLFENLGYSVAILPFHESGRTFLSKGFVEKARKIAYKNLSKIKSYSLHATPVVGLEPSAVHTFRDEYLTFFDNSEGKIFDIAKQLAENSYTFEEFLEKEINSGNIDKSKFDFASLKKIHIHRHCYQKTFEKNIPSTKIFSDSGADATEIPSGCCGMAGAFGYEKKHYELSMKIGETVLFPYIRNLKQDEIIAASGTSCRQQIEDGTGKTAKHPVNIFWEAMKR